MTFLLTEKGISFQKLKFPKGSSFHMFTVSNCNLLPTSFQWLSYSIRRNTPYCHLQILASHCINY